MRTARGLVWVVVVALGVGCGARTGLDVGAGDASRRAVPPPPPPDGSEPGPDAGPGRAPPSDAGLDAGLPEPPLDVDGGPGPVVPPDVRPRQLIAAGWRHTCAAVRGVVWCWGFDTSGQCGGDRSSERVDRPNRIALDGVAVEVSAGEQHSCALLSSGEVRCWGNNDIGQLGDGTTRESRSPVRVLDVHDAVRVGAAGSHTCALSASGQVWCWGHGGFGQLGDGTRNSSSRAHRVPGISDAVDFEAGRRHTCVVRRSGARGGQLTCWGANGQGQLGRETGSGTDELTPIDLAGYDDVVVVNAGAYHTCALRTGHAVDCWGSSNVSYGGGYWGTLGFEFRPVSTFARPAHISAGDRGTTCDVEEDGRVRCFTVSGGEASSGPIGTEEGRDISGIADANEVSVGYEHACATLAAGGVACWGSNEFGQLGHAGVVTPDGFTPVRVDGL